MNTVTRRRFLHTSAGLAGGLVAGLNPRAQGSNERVRVAIVGLGGRGIGLAQMFARRPDIEIAWMCDPDRRRWARSVAAFSPSLPKEPRTTADFRQVLEDREVDALVVATPDHWHGLVTILACQAGKDVYVEKPMAHNVREGQAMIAAARKYERVVQVGTQSRSAPYARAAKEYVESGKLGNVHQVRIYNMMEHPSTPLGPEGRVPEGFDYDLWCGPAAKLPYHPDRRWLSYSAFSVGAIAGDAVHQLDLARYAMGDPAHPGSVSCHGGIVALNDGRDTADTQTAVFDYGSYTFLLQSALWTPYMKKTDMAVRDTDEFPDWAFCATKIEVLGTRGYLYLGRHGDGWQVFDADQKRVVSESGKQADHEHIRDFVECTRSRRRPLADVAVGHASTLLCHLANASWRAGNVALKFDAATESFPERPEANALLGRDYRAPWSLPS